MLLGATVDCAMNSTLVSGGWNESKRILLSRHNVGAHDLFFDAGQNVTGCAIQANQPLRYCALGRAERSSTASVKTTPQGRHSNDCNSGRPPTRGVTRASFMG